MTKTVSKFLKFVEIFKEKTIWTNSIFSEILETKKEKKRKKLLGKNYYHFKYFFPSIPSKLFLLLRVKPQWLKVTY